MKLQKLAGATSEIWQIFIADSSSTTGAGLTGLVFNSAGLVAYYHRDTDTTATAISLVTMTVGTFTSSGFKEIDATNMPGWYQFCPPNAALTGAKSCGIHLKGATNMAPLPIEVQLTAVNPDSATAFVSSVVAASVAPGGISAASFAAGAIDNAAIATDAIGSAELAASAVTEMQAGLATASALTSIDTKIGTPAASIAADVAAVAAKTINLPTDPADASDIAALFAAVSAAIAAIPTTAMTESYAADGATMTQAQALYEIRALLSEFSIVGTTMTTRKKDGATTAGTYTLDSATSPTSITRTT